MTSRGGSPARRVVTISVDGRPARAEEETPLLAALRREGKDIPSLCHHEALAPYGACRLCLVEVNQKGWKPDWRRLTTSCNFPVLDGLEVFTGTDRVKGSVRVVLELLLARAPAAETVRDLASRYGVEVESRFREVGSEERCIDCALCTRVCDRLGHGAITILERGVGRRIGTPADGPPPDCVGCATCARICPTGAIPVEEARGLRRIWGRDFELARCVECGKGMLTVEQARYHAGRTGLDESYFRLCDECSRRRVARTMLENLT